MDLSRRDWLRASAAAAVYAAYVPERPVQAEKTPAGSSLIVRTEEPFNAEPSLTRLVSAAITPAEEFYVRNHGPQPRIAAADCRVRLEGLVHKSQEITLAEIQCSITQMEQVATLTCAGNRRREMSQIRAVPGVQWDAGAIGHAKWTGAVLGQVLKMAEVKPEAKHVWFEGLDPIKEKDDSMAPFGASIPLARALDTKQPALLAHTMNGKPLLPEHGFPLRAVVPGYIGARSVKWLAKIVVSDMPSPNHYVAEAYKLVGTDSKEELSKAEPIYEFPINSAICFPNSGAMLKAGDVIVAGYALPPGDGKSTIGKVELSIDGGRTWKAAKTADEPTANCWQLWSAKVSLPAGDHELVVRATDNSGRQQPERAEWNLKGYLYNAWHRCAVKVSA